MQLFIKAYDDTELNVLVNEIRNPKGIVIISHGFLEQVVYYNSVAYGLNQRGYTVIRYDMRSHGSTKAPLGDLKDYRDLLLDLDTLVSYSQTIASDCPIYTMGFSLGGLVTALYGLEYGHRIDGQILLAPGLCVQDHWESLNQSSISVLALFTALIKDDLWQLSMIEQALSRAPFKRVTQAFVLETLVNAPMVIQARMSMYACPCLIFHGDCDSIVPLESSQAFYETIESKAKALKVLKGVGHNIFQSQKKEMVMDATNAWLENLNRVG
ncbi:alpha/beta hydrolase [Erysipelothrix sp. P66]|uniref:alpha/beta hydrolase n=1 Tax=Erysipelothrix sp. P66 TaxID=3141531 RepID=UPI00315DA222